MRVALDAGPLLDPPTGVGRYVRELGAALERRGIEVRRFAASLRGSDSSGIARLRVPARVLHRMWLVAERPALDRLVGDVDVVHGTNFVMPLVRRAPGVVTIHDLSFFHDYAFPGRKGWTRMVPWSVRRAAKVIVPTEAVATEVAERFDLARERIAVTHEGAL